MECDQEMLDLLNSMRAKLHAHNRPGLAPGLRAELRDMIDGALAKMGPQQRHCRGRIIGEERHG